MVSTTPETNSRTGLRVLASTLSIAMVIAAMVGLASPASAETNTGPNCQRLLLLAEWNHNMSVAYGGWGNTYKSNAYNKAGNDALDFYAVNCW